MPMKGSIVLSDEILRTIVNQSKTEELHIINFVYKIKNKIETAAVNSNDCCNNGYNNGSYNLI